MSIYTCPHCGKKTFNPLSKAFAGQLNSKGKPCRECGRLCVNGKAATIFNAVYSTVVFALIIIVYLKSPTWVGTSLEWVYWREILVVLVLLLSKWIVPRLANAFLFRLEPAIRVELRQ